MSQNHSALRSHPLYQELLYVGARDKSLKPLALRKHKHLLNSPEVLRRAKKAGTTDLDSLANHSSKAIYDAIDGLPMGARYTVGQAALCAATKYENTMVEQRKAMLLEGPEKITHNMFRYHRDEAFREIITFLDQGVLADPLDDDRVEARIPVASEFSKLNYSLRCLSRDAFELHCASLVSLFVCEFDRQLAQQSVAAFTLRDVQVCARYLFNAYVMFLSSSRYSVIEHPDLLHEWAASRMDDDQYAWLVKAVQEINGYCSLTLDVGDATEWALTDWAFEVTGESDMHMRDLYSELWQPWYFRQWPFRTTSPSDVERIAAKSGALLRELVRHLGSDRPAQEDSLYEASQTAGGYYGITPTTAVANGLSLHQCMVQFCRHESRRLAKSKLA